VYPDVTATSRKLIVELLGPDDELKTHEVAWLDLTQLDVFFNLLSSCFAHFINKLA